MEERVKIMSDNQIGKFYSEKQRDTQKAETS
jgi:hypothetical protein